MIDAARVPMRWVHCCGWRDTEAVTFSGDRRHVLMRAAHHMGIFPLNSARHSAPQTPWNCNNSLCTTLPQPHRRLTASCWLHSATPEDYMHLIAAGDDRAVLTTHRISAQPDSEVGSSSSTIFIGDNWSALFASSAPQTGSLSRIGALLQSTTDGSYILCQRDYDATETPAHVWMASLEQHIAWSVPLPRCVPSPWTTSTAEDRMPVLFDVRTAGASPPRTFAAAHSRWITIHTAATAAAQASFPLTANGEWEVQSILSGCGEDLTESHPSTRTINRSLGGSSSDHGYVVTLTEVPRAGSRYPTGVWLAGFDDRQPREAVWWCKLFTRLCVSEDEGEGEEFVERHTLPVRGPVFTETLGDGCFAFYSASCPNVGGTNHAKAVHHSLHTIRPLMGSSVVVHPLSVDRGRWCMADTSCVRGIGLMDGVLHCVCT